jgi:Cu-Zn family superoxide dismutase
MDLWRSLGLLVLASGLGSCEGLSLDPETRSAEAVLFDTSGMRIGEAVFSEIDEDPIVVMRLQAWGLPPGVHGMHIHEAGACESPDFETAGGHFNPFGKKHGLKNPDGPHAGDLPNLVVPLGGKVDVTIAIRRVTLGEGNHSLLSPQGTSLVIHADPDDGTTDPEGNSGLRIACGVIRPPMSAR